MTFTKSQRNAVAGTSDGLPALGVWLQRVEALNVPELTAAIEGIWCGREGRSTLEIAGSKSMLCVGWYNGRVEFSYLS